MDTIFTQSDAAVTILCNALKTDVTIQERCLLEIIKKHGERI